MKQIPEMFRTIMQPANPWRSLDLSPLHSERSSRNNLGFSPNATGFSMISQGMNSKMYSTMQQSDNSRPFSLEDKPEVIAALKGESSVLFKVPPNGTVARFRPRRQRRQETWGERNNRLGYISTRTSGGKA